MNIEAMAGQVEMHLAAYETEGKHFANLAGQEIDYETQRMVLKSTLIEGIVGTDNEATKRPHSADSAEKAAVVRPEYIAHMRLVSQTVVAKNKAAVAMHSAYLRTSLVVALIKQEIGAA